MRLRVTQPGNSPVRIGKIDTNSDHPELHPAGFADHVLIPRRIPNELHVGLIHAVDGQNLALRIMCNGWSHATTGRSESHLHFHASAAIISFDQTAIVNQTKINNIHADLWIVTLPKLV